ncbi:MAG: lytic transglycosylase domain-containing protein [Chloroflexota bacterium]|nr:MAG: lytic transglycosylase domain-containing protein [Chloroflexota bacterium]
MPDWGALAYQIAVEEGHSWPDLFVRQMRVESGFAEDVIYCRRFSSAGARGIAQFMPGTAAGLGIDPCLPEAALRAAARLMQAYYRRYGRWDVALAAYNAGSGAVQEYDGVPPYRETQRYIALLLGGQSEPPSSAGAAPGVNGAAVMMLAGLMVAWWLIS